LQIELLPLDQIVPFDRNPRTHPAWQITQIAASIEEFGFVNPILLGADGIIIAGHGRFEAARLIGLEVVPVIRLGHLNSEQRRALVIADNKIAENAQWDMDLLRELVGELHAEHFDLDLLGFSDEELGDLMDFAPDEDVAPPAPGDPDHLPDIEARYVSQAGDIWILGDHRLMCGDSTDMGVVSLLCKGDLVDACWTDPPYNVNYEGSAGKIQNDNMDAGAFRRFLIDAFSAAASNMRAGAPIYVAHADTEGLNFRRAFADAGFKLSGCLVWVKPSLVLGRSDYQWRHEPILYGWKPGAPHAWFGGRANTTVIEHKGESLRIMPDGSIQIDVAGQVVIIEGEKMSMRSVDSSIIRHSKPAKNGDHPTMKPVDLICGMLENSTQTGSVVLDLFGGSGSTLIACEKMGRRARLMELDEKFCDVIIRRWQEFTGRQAILEGDGRGFEAVGAKGRAV
jgi:DNA modification methylase